MNVVIDNLGDVVKAGFCDFSDELLVGQTQRTDGPEPALVFGRKLFPGEKNNWHRWNGSEYEVIEAG